MHKLKGTSSMDVPFKSSWSSPLMTAPVDHGLVPKPHLDGNPLGTFLSPLRYMAKREYPGQRSLETPCSKLKGIFVPQGRMLIPTARLKNYGICARSCAHRWGKTLRNTHSIVFALSGVDPILQCSNVFLGISFFKDQDASRMAAGQGVIYTVQRPVVPYCFCWKDMLLFSSFFRTADAGREASDDRDEQNPR